MQKPSFITSTFSVVTLILVVSFVALCILERDLQALTRMAEMIICGYGIKKGMEMGKK